MDQIFTEEEEDFKIVGLLFLANVEGGRISRLNFF